MLAIFATTADLPLVTFDGASSTTFTFVELNDPVMGGQSRGTWALNTSYGVMDGAVLDVPSLKAFPSTPSPNPSPSRVSTLSTLVLSMLIRSYLIRTQAPGFIKAAADGTFPDVS
jgi:hypothetical protein